MPGRHGGGAAGTGRFAAEARPCPFIEFSLARGKRRRRNSPEPPLADPRRACACRNPTDLLAG